MYIILATPNESGSYPALQSWSSSNCPETHYFFPEEFYPVFYNADKQCAGFVNITVDAEIRTVIACEWNEEAYQAYIATLPPPYEPTNSDRRKQAYETGRVDGDPESYFVIWNGTEYTTDALTTLGQQYEFRGETETAAAIALIVQAGVEKIRKAYPDEEEATTGESTETAE